ncbi:MFS transporter [Gordonia sp. OPL2]|uniref:MFS transporter n=1 Tax=Gordonia sp. OPL2 TaxID=2486274 RepID=UPI001654D193|nr:MFS transporter [Gordonia sp. OPL2]ROZ99051.1 MFS transporter [Gordonia sp. OPL2]
MLEKSGRPGRDHRVTFLVLMTSAAAMALLQSVVIPVLPALQTELDTSTVGVTWVLTSFLLSASVFTPIAGSCGDLLGRKRMFVASLVVLGFGTAMAAVADTLALMIAARVIQGLSGGLLPASFGIIRDEFPAHKVAGAIGFLAALLAVGFGAGIVLAGPIEASLGVRWVFWIPLIAISASAALAAWVIAPDEPRTHGGGINWAAATFLAGWLLCLLLAITQAPSVGWLSWRVWTLVGVAVLLAVTWSAIETRSTAPLIDLRVMRAPAVWTAHLSSFLLGVGMFAAFTALPQFLQGPAAEGIGLDTSVTASGVIILPISAGMFLLGLGAGRLTARFGARGLLITGSGIASGGYFGIAAAHNTAGTVALWCTVVGVGLGLAFSAVSNLVLEAVPQEMTGAVSGVNVNIRLVGGAVGAALMAGLVTLGSTTDGEPSGTGYTIGFAMVGTAVALSAVVAGFAPPRQRTPIRN